MLRWTLGGWLSSGEPSPQKKGVSSWSHTSGNPGGVVLIISVGRAEGANTTQRACSTRIQPRRRIPSRRKTKLTTITMTAVLITRRMSMTTQVKTTSVRFTRSRRFTQLSGVGCSCMSVCPLTVALRCVCSRYTEVSGFP